MVDISNPDAVRNQWLKRLGELIQDIENWAKALDWATRRIEVTLKDSHLGSYKAPALLLQEDAVRIILEPIARAAPGADGVVDLYLMPAYDDIASLYFYDEQWHVHYMFPDSPTVANIREAEPQPLTLDVLRHVLDEMKQHAV